MTPDDALARIKTLIDYAINTGIDAYNGLLDIPTPVYDILKRSPKDLTVIFGDEGDETVHIHGIPVHIAKCQGDVVTLWGKTARDVIEGKIQLFGGIPTPMLRSAARTISRTDQNGIIYRDHAEMVFAIEKATRADLDEIMEGDST